MKVKEKEFPLNKVAYIGKEGTREKKKKMKKSSAEKNTELLNTEMLFSEHLTELMRDRLRSVRGYLKFRMFLYFSACFFNACNFEERSKWGRQNIEWWFFFVRTLMMSNKCSNFDHIERCAKQEEEEEKNWPFPMTNTRITHSTFFCCSNCLANVLHVFDKSYGVFPYLQKNVT